MTNQLKVFILCFICISSYSQEAGSLTVPTECGNEEAKYCLIGSYRSNMTITLIPNNSGLTCRVLTGKETIVTRGDRQFNGTTLIDNNNCKEITKYRVAVAGPVDSYRRAQIEESPAPSDLSSIQEAVSKSSNLANEEVESLKIYNFEKNLFNYYLINPKLKNSKSSPLLVYQNTKVVGLFEACYDDMKAVIVKSKLYLVVRPKSCPSDNDFIRIYLFSRDAFPAEVYNERRFLKN